MRQLHLQYRYSLFSIMGPYYTNQQSVQKSQHRSLFRQSRWTTASCREATGWNKMIVRRAFLTRSTFEFEKSAPSAITDAMAISACTLAFAVSGKSPFMTTASRTSKIHALTIAWDSWVHTSWHDSDITRHYHRHCLWSTGSQWHVNIPARLSHVAVQAGQENCTFLGIR